MGFLYWIIVGLIAGWLAGVVMKGGGYGVLMDIVLGVIGGILGGWLFGALGFSAGGGALGSIWMARRRRDERRWIRRADGHRSRCHWRHSRWMALRRSRLFRGGRPRWIDHRRIRWCSRSRGNHADASTRVATTESAHEPDQRAQRRTHPASGRPRGTSRVEEVGTVSERAAVGHRARRLQLQRRRLELLLPRQRSVPRIP